MNRMGKGILFLTTAYDKEKSPMASGSRSGSGLGKRLKYIDWDAPILSSKDPWDRR